VCNGPVYLSATACQPPEEERVSKLIPFDAIAIGTELGPVEARVSPQSVRDYCEDWDDPNPWYLAESPFGGPVAPPAFLAGLTCFQLLGSRYDARSTIGVQTSHRNLRPIPVGETLVTRGRIADKYVKRGLEYVVVSSTTYASDGMPCRESTDHILLSLERVEP
jgi:acyl dehydratase